MYLALTKQVSILKKRLRTHRRKLERAKRLRDHKRAIKRVFLGFIGITGIVLIWSGISRFATSNLTLGDSIALGVGLLFVSGLLTKNAECNQ